LKSYFDLIDQSFEFPTDEFKVSGKYLEFHGIPLKKVLDKYGTPLRLTYLPKISENIQNARTWFSNAMKKHHYEGSYTYCYCTKSNHFEYVLDKVLENNCQIETSSAFDIQIVKKLYEKGKLKKDALIVCNGFKRPLYSKYISKMVNNGFENCIPVLDNLNELDHYKNTIKKDFKIGIRVAADEEPSFEFYTSRLGIRYSNITNYYKEAIQGSRAKLKMLHFFINTGIRDTAYYWSELSRFLYQYCELKRFVLN
jgi:arginine decarboxylase